MGKLILKRKVGEAIEVDGPAVITMLRGSKLMIDAPRSTHVIRTEIERKEKDDGSDERNEAA